MLSIPPRITTDPSRSSLTQPVAMPRPFDLRKGGSERARQALKPEAQEQCLEPTWLRKIVTHTHRQANTARTHTHTARTHVSLQDPNTEATSRVSTPRRLREPRARASTPFRQPRCLSKALSGTLWCPAVAVARVGTGSGLPHPCAKREELTETEPTGGALNYITPF